MHDSMLVSSLPYNQAVYELKSFEEIGAEEWDKFVLATDNGSIHQVSAWKALQERVPSRGRVFGWAAVKDTAIVAATLAVRMKTGIAGSEWYYSGRGPVYTDRKATVFLIEQVARQLKTATKALFWRYDPYLLEKEKPLISKKLASKPAAQNYHPPNTLIIDLAPDTEKLWHGLKPKRRYNIRYGRSHCNSMVIPGAKATATDIDDFYRLLNATAQRDAFNAHPKQYYADFLNVLGNYTTLWFSLFEHQRVATAILSVCGDKAIYYFAALSDDKRARRAHPAHYLMWEMIKYAERKGAATLDLLGVAPEGVTDHPYAGITMFKESFGGTRVNYQPGVEVTLRPAAHAAYRAAKRIKR